MFCGETKKKLIKPDYYRNIYPPQKRIFATFRVSSRRSYRYAEIENKSHHWQNRQLNRVK